MAEALQLASASVPATASAPATLAASPSALGREVRHGALQDGVGRLGSRFGVAVARDGRADRSDSHREESSPSFADAKRAEGERARRQQRDAAEGCRCEPGAPRSRSGQTTARSIAQAARSNGHLISVEGPTQQVGDPPDHPLLECPAGAPQTVPSASRALSASGALRARR